MKPCRVRLWVILGLLTVPIARAEELTLAFQRGADAYEGVEDTFLYAPNSVANINYGASESLSAGINRWNERYVSLIRFDLGILPPGARVLGASLWLYDVSKEWPSKEIEVAVQAIAEANRSWREGANDGTRVPVSGTACWNYLRYDDKAWAGKAGLGLDGIDYLSPAAGSAVVPADHEGWIEFRLDNIVVQRWIDDPQSNAGLRIGPPKAREKGEILTVASSDITRDVERRPKLVVSLDLSEETARHYAHTLALRALDAADQRFDEVREAVEKHGRPRRAEAALVSAEIRLNRLREQLKPVGAHLRSAGDSIQEGLSYVKDGAGEGWAAVRESLESARKEISKGLDQERVESVREKLKAAKRSVEDGLDSVKEFLEPAADRAEEGVDTVRDKLRPARERIDEALASVGERLDPTKDMTRAQFDEIARALHALQRELDEVADTITIARAAAFNESQHIATDFALAIADSTTNVLRQPALFEGEFASVARVAMAKNEFEAVQIVIVPIDMALAGATWSMTDLEGPEDARIPSGDITVRVMGYMKSIKPAVDIEGVDWWPAPILDFMDAVDVGQGELQPLWLCVRTRPDTPAGAYVGTLTVHATDLESKRIEIAVEVFDFAVPVDQHLLTVWGNNEPTYEAMYGERYTREMAHAMFDFFIEHRLAVNSLYASQAAGRQVGASEVGYPTLSDPEELKRLWEKGSRWWNLGYLHPVHAKAEGLPFEEYVPVFIEKIRASLDVADAAGWPRENLGIYFFDETKDFDTLNAAASQVKAAFPDVPLMTTGYDRSYGVKEGPIDKSIDIWCPLTPRFVEDLDTIAQGRAQGKKAWWYVCCGPRGRNDLNFFTQFPAIRSRLLMGVATWKYKPDGFLYYRVSGWKNYEKPIDSGPLTNWTPYYLPGPDGDGELIGPGPNGPLSTLQFENIRDGIEDYEYLWVLDDAVRRAQEAGLRVADAEELLEVPGDLLERLDSYSEDAARLRAHRRAIAEAIVRIERQLGG
ncbi:MAG TPA: DUF6067 family protein [Candidatus Hydrogenedentes bacterium]|nr:DUF6067 family protein [Candidatus Hydrogenedentota bacterium]